MDNSSEGRLRNMTAVYLTAGDRILLLYRQGSRVVNNLWTGSAGGHFEPYEINDAKACVLRELQEERKPTDDMLSRLSLRYITLRRTKGEIRQNYYFFAELKNADKVDLSSNEGTLQWFDISEIDNLPMPLTARQVIDHWVKEGRTTQKLYGCVSNIDKAIFSELSED